jgi:regulator of replication initiation timing
MTPAPGEPDATTAEPSDDSEPDESDVKPAAISTDTSVDEEAICKPANGLSKTVVAEDPTARFDDLIKDRDALRAEVTKLRQSLEELQSKHQNELEDVQTQLHETQGEKDHAEELYQNLLGKVNTIRSQLGERLKADAVRIDRTWLLLTHPDVW